MKTINGFLVFSLLLLARGQVLAVPPEAAAIFEKAGIQLTDTDLYRVAEVYNFWGQKGESIWPGLDLTTTPVQLVFPEKQDILIGHPDPPEDCVREDIKLPGFNKTFCHRPGRNFMYGGGTAPLNKVPTISVNTMDVFDAYTNALWQKNNPKAEKYSKPYLLYLGEVAHELAHAYQDTESRYLPAQEKEHAGLKVMKVDYPYQDEEACVLLAVEGRVLSELLEENDPAHTRELWLDFSAVRAERHKRLVPDMVKLERYMELKEGPAQYVGWSLQYGKNDDVKPLTETLSDPRFTGYASTDTVKEVIKQRLMGLNNPLRAKWMGYIYDTGAALAYSLDKAVPGWKKDTFRRMSGLYGGLDTLITENLPLNEDSGKRVKKLYGRYKAKELRKPLKEILGKELAENKLKLEKFLSAPGKRYRLVFRGTKPEDLQISASVLLTEYKDRRIFEAGIGRIAAGGAGVVQFSRALPVMLNKKTGQFNLTVPEKYAAPSAVKAGKTAVKNGASFYSGGVEFNNGVWSWKGEKLEVREKDGVTTLTF